MLADQVGYAKGMVKVDNRKKLSETKDMIRLEECGAEEMPVGFEGDCDGREKQRRINRWGEGKESLPR